MSAAAAAFVALAVGHAAHEAKLKALKVVELRAICMDFGLESTGDKAALMDRVRTHKQDLCPWRRYVSSVGIAKITKM